MTGISGAWALITVLVLVITEIMLFINIKTEGEGGAALTAMTFFWIGSIALIPLLWVTSKLDSPTTGTMLGNLWNPFTISVIVIWLLCLIFMRSLGRKPNKG